LVIFDEKRVIMATFPSKYITFPPNQPYIWDNFGAEYNYLIMVKVISHSDPFTIVNPVSGRAISLEELAKIERSFEVGYWRGLFVKDRMFNGLSAVIDTLDEIHDNNDTIITGKVKSKFQKEGPFEGI
jgi:hypothetical protein